MIYLDNAATTRPLDEVSDMVCETMKTVFGNPSSKHMCGVEAETVLKEAKNRIAVLLKVQEKEIIFTSGATEGNNTAILGVARRRKRSGMHIITTKLEHPSVREPFLKLEEEGFRVTYLDPDEKGLISPDDLKKALDDETTLVSVMYVHNETGALQPIEELGKVIKDHSRDICFHVDAVQAFGKLKVLPKSMNADLVTASAHKFHGPKGVGFLYIKEGVRCDPFIIGGGQQKNMRSGTENVPGIAGMAKALESMYDEGFEERIRAQYELRDYFINALDSVEDVNVFCKDSAYTAPNIISASFLGIKSEVLLHQLESDGVFVSSGSACSSNKPGLSFSLAAMGATREELDSIIRFSFSYETKKEELDRVVELLKIHVPFLRQFVRK